MNQQQANSPMGAGQQQPMQQSMQRPMQQQSAQPEMLGTDVNEMNDGFMAEQQASPEEQEQYKQFVGQALSLIYDERMFPRIQQVLTGGGQGGDPAQGLAMAAAMVTARVAQAGEQKGVRLSGDVVFHAGKEVFEDLAELSGKLRIKDYQNDPDALERAFFMALDQFRVGMQQMGRADQPAAQKELSRLMQMDQSGELEAKLREMMSMEKRRRQGIPEQSSGMMREEPEPRQRGLMAMA